MENIFFGIQFSTTHFIISYSFPTKCKGEIFAPKKYLQNSKMLIFPTVSRQELQFKYGVREDSITGSAL